MKKNPPHCVFCDSTDHWTVDHQIRPELRQSGPFRDVKEAALYGSIEAVKSLLNERTVV